MWDSYFVFLINLFDNLIVRNEDLNLKCLYWKHKETSVELQFPHKTSEKEIH